LHHVWSGTHPSTIDSEITQLRSSVRHNRNDNRDRTRQPDDHHDGDHYRLDDFERYRRPSPRSDRHRNDRLLSSMTHPTTIMTTKEKSSIRKPTIGNITLVMAVVADTTISSPPPENMLASLMKHQLLIATTTVDVLAINPVIVILTIPTVIVHLTLVVKTPSRYQSFACLPNYYSCRFIEVWQD